MQQRNIKIIKKKKLKIERVKKLNNACYNKLLIQQQNMRNKPWPSCSQNQGIATMVTQLSW